MNVNLPPVYAPFYAMPESEREGGFVITSYEHMAKAARSPYFMKIKLRTDVAMDLAEQSPYPAGVKLAVMKQVAMARVITLEQLRILLGWAAQRAQGVQVSLRNTYQQLGLGL